MDATDTMLESRFCRDNYMIRKKVLKLLGQAFHIYGDAGDILFYGELKAFKLKEDIRLYAGEDKMIEVLNIRARQVLDVAATYDVYDPVANVHVGAVRRKWIRSMVRDEWHILDTSDRELGLIREDSLALALVRRFALSILPQSFTGTAAGQKALEFHRHFNPFVLRMDLDFSPDRAGLLDRRLGIAAAVLLTAIEGRQQ